MATISVSLLDNEADTTILKIRRVLLILDKAAPELVIRWLDRERPPAILDADLQKIWGIVDAAMSAYKRRHMDGKEYDYTMPVGRIRGICRVRLGEVH